MCPPQMLLARDSWGSDEPSCAAHDIVSVFQLGVVGVVSVVAVGAGGGAGAGVCCRGHDAARVSVAGGQSVTFFFSLSPASHSRAVWASN